ncbi:unnamed protein product [Candidula unifasciata]|uniref:Uncharacterized protein n=1 Tax=Candidula unifasciata TaxID=100452 RepID=A0A8S3YP58_9EUPU|nr:unnamed protein product [Candidula unifasciata]
MISFKDVLGTHEIKTMRFAKAIVAEALGTCMLVIVGCGAASTLGSKDGSDLAVSMSFGLAVSMGIWLFGHISGGHINPSVSIGFLVTGHISVLKCVCYLIGQIAGSIAGATILWLILPLSLGSSYGSPSLAEGVADWQGVIIEMFAAFSLVMTVFASCDRLRTDHSGSIALAIGFCVTAQITWMGSLTGGSLNPARALGPTIFAGKWDNHWVYWTGPIAGGILAAVMYERIFAEKTRETDKEMRHVQYNNCDIQSNGFLDYVIEIDAPASSEPENKPPAYHTKNNNTIEVINLEERLDKEHNLPKANISLDSFKHISTIEDMCICVEEEDKPQDDSNKEDTSNL